ncbi:hypothetical protein BKA93DRAFT_825551 [Sparassis latifolia]
MSADIPIDPMLLQQSEHLDTETPEHSVLDFISQIQVTASELRTTPSRSSSSGPEPDEDQHVNLDSSHAQHGIRRTRAEFEGEDYGNHIDAVEFGQCLKRQRNLTPDSESELARFTEATHLIQHTIFTYTLLLECRDHLSRLSWDSEYKVPGTLRVTLLDYAHSYILSPSIISYRSASNPANILGAMRRLNISQLPPDQETVAVVLSNSSRQGSHGVVQPCKDSDYHVHQCTPTVALYIRLAYIRFILVKFLGLKEDEFWTKVDSSMKEIREICKTRARSAMLTF